jgi:DNA-binding IclR family transcriptional regulator
MPTAIPHSVQLLLRERIQSIAQLEVLLSLRAAPATIHCVAELAKELYTPESMTASLLEGLRTRGLAERVEGAPSGYRYAPKTAELARAVDELAQLYQQRRVTIINLIYSNPVKTLQDFADAFRIRPPEET